LGQTSVDPLADHVIPNHGALCRCEESFFASARSYLKNDLPEGALKLVRHQKVS